MFRKEIEYIDQVDYKKYTKLFITEYATVDELTEIIGLAEKRLDDLNER